MMPRQVNDLRSIAVGIYIDGKLFKICKKLGRIFGCNPVAPFVQNQDIADFVPPYARNYCRTGLNLNERKIG